MMRGTLWTVGSLLGAAVLGAVLSDRNELVAAAAILTVLCLLGAGLLSIRQVRERWAWAQTAEDRRAVLEAALAGYLRDGNVLARQINHHPGPPDSDLALLTDEARRWATGVSDRLKREKPSLVAVFLDDTSGVESVSQHGERDTLRNWITRRLARLGDVIERVSRA